MKKPYFTPFNRVLEILSWLLILASFVVAIYGMNTLPDTIAVHFALDGTPDGYGSPGSLLVFPIIMLFSIGIISLIAHFLKPEEGWNMPFKVREQNRDAVYTCMMTMLFLIELESAALTLYIEVQSYYQSGKGAWQLVLLYLAAMTATIIILTVRASRINKQQKRPHP